MRAAGGFAILAQLEVEFLSMILDLGLDAVVPASPLDVVWMGGLSLPTAGIALLSSNSAFVDSNLLESSVQSAVSGASSMAQAGRGSDDDDTGSMLSLVDGVVSGTLRPAPFVLVEAPLPRPRPLNSDRPLAALVDAPLPRPRPLPCSTLLGTLSFFFVTSPNFVACPSEIRAIAVSNSPLDSSKHNERSSSDQSWTSISTGQ